MGSSKVILDLIHKQIFYKSHWLSLEEQITCDNAILSYRAAIFKCPLDMNDTNIESNFLSLFWFAATGETHDTRKYNLVIVQVLPSKLIELNAIIDSASSLNRY